MQEHISHPLESVTQTGCVPKKQEMANRGRHDDTAGARAWEDAPVGEGGGTGNSGAEAAGLVPADPTEATGTDEAGAAGNEAEIAEAIEPVAKGEGAAGDEPGARGAGALVVWLALAASAI